MSWMLNHINTAEDDPFGIAGTISDWHYDEATGVETNKHTYSSTDAGTTVPLIVAHDAFRTGDRDLQHLVIETIEKYELMASATAVEGPIRNPDGLCWARPNSKVKYVADNSVVYRGLSCLAALERAAGRLEQARFYDRQARHTRQGMFDILWNEDFKNWSWTMGIYNLKVSYPKQAFMPDAWCQYWQVFLKVTRPSDRKSILSWQAFSEAWPRWMYNEIPKQSPHNEIAYCAVQMGEPEDAVTMIRTCRDKFGGSNNWAWPWYIGEAGHTLRTCRLLIDSGYVN
ncbi:hypothetical protein [Microlunatus sp. Y2014]|uniref:hypothetical protein n=1 Tax=Microlunatus sp. Y2014 TaxID=3418488 RepID=UPI003DA77670